MRISGLRTSLGGQQGAGLIEIMVSLTLLAVGLMGILSLQTTSVKGSQQSQFSSSALHLANDMVNRIYAYDDVDNLNDNDDFDEIDTQDNVANPGCDTEVCDAAEQVEFAQWEWREALRSQLPGGRGLIDFDDASGIYTVTVMWTASLLAPRVRIAVATRRWIYRVTAWRWRYETPSGYDIA